MIELKEEENNIVVGSNCRCNCWNDFWGIVYIGRMPFQTCMSRCFGEVWSCDYIKEEL